MSRAKKINSDVDPGGVIVERLQTVGISDRDLWQYALQEVQDRGSYAAMRWLIEAEHAWPHDLRGHVGDAVARVNDYRPREGIPPKLNTIEREVVRIDWVFFCADWFKQGRRINPPVAKWVEIFQERLRAVAVRMGHPAPTDAQLRRIAPLSTLRLMIADIKPYKRRVQ